MTTLRQSQFHLSRAALVLAAALAAALGLSSPQSAAAAAVEERADAGLGDLIDRALHEDGPFFEARERAVIERKCGYAPGSWDGFDATISGGVFHCTNGRRLDDAETRAILARAEPRIERRVQAVMRRPEIHAAIERVARQAAAQALRELSDSRPR
jgi:hypothetical protein